MDQSKFWKLLAKIGIIYANKNLIPMEVILENGSISFNIDDVLRKWQNDFSSLFSAKDWVMLATILAVMLLINDPAVNASNQQMSYNQLISILEVKKAIDAAKRGKATGIDNIPMEVMKNDTAVSFLHVLFNICFDNGSVPSDWGQL